MKHLLVDVLKLVQATSGPHRLGLLQAEATADRSKPRDRLSLIVLSVVAALSCRHTVRWRVEKAWHSLTLAW